MSTIEDLLANQNQLIDAMQQILRNFKKDPADRKTATYLKKRLDMLESYWSEFQANHVQLTMYENQNFAYFSENYYQKSKTLYNEVRTTIQQGKITEQFAKEKSPVDPKIQITETPALGEPSKTQRNQSNNEKSLMETVSQGNPSKAEEMLRRQRSNF